MTIQHVSNQEGILEAALERDLEKAFLVFFNDLQVRKLSRDDARALFKEMTDKTLNADAGYAPLK